jgi:hypothetical protein
MKIYGKAFLNFLRARGIWEAGKNIIPGDYGIIIDECFVKLGSISELGVISEDPEETEDASFEFSTKLNSPLPQESLLWFLNQCLRSRKSPSCGF